jgi:hypothetical protein
VRTKRALRATGWGIGNAAAALVTLGAVTGCGMQGGGIAVVGANPATVPVVAPVSATAAGESSATAQGDAALLTTRGGRGTAAAATSTGIAASTSTGSATGGQNGAVGGTSTVNGTATTSTTALPTDTAIATPPAGVCGAGALNLQVMTSTTAAYVGGGTNAGRRTFGVSTRPQQLTLAFTNVSHSSCTLRGYPNVDFLRGGIRGPLSAPDSFAPSPRVADVRLAPGEVATAEITFTANGADNPHGSRCDQVIAVRVYAPGSTKALTAGAHDVAGHRIPSFYVCGHGVVVHAVQRG